MTVEQLVNVLVRRKSSSKVMVATADGQVEIGALFTLTKAEGNRLEETIVIGTVIPKEISNDSEG